MQCSAMQCKVNELAWQFMELGVGPRVWQRPEQLADGAVDWGERVVAAPHDQQRTPDRGYQLIWRRPWRPCATASMI